LFYTVYKITNNVNDKYYIGKHQTKDLDDGYMGSGKLIQRAIQKYGIENFTKEILHVFDTEEEMNLKEAELVIVSEETYNLCEGGKGGFSYINNNSLNAGRHVIHKFRHMGSKSLKGKTYDEIYGIKKSNEYRKLLAVRCRERQSNIIPSKVWTGQKHTNKTKTRMSESHKGSKNSQFGTCWITNGNEVKKIPLEALDSHLEMGYHKGRK